MYGTRNIIRVSASSCVQFFCLDIPNAEEDTASTPYVVNTCFPSGGLNSLMASARSWNQHEGISFQLAGIEVVFATRS